MPPMLRRVQAVNTENTEVWAKVEDSLYEGEKRRRVQESVRLGCSLVVHLTRD
jgi:hypothetical protein